MNKNGNSLDEKNLKKTLSPINVLAVSFGCIIGWGAFINPGKKFLPDSGVLGTAIALSIGALIMIIISKCYSYMVQKYPKSGGEFTYAKECFGRKAAYFCGWFLISAYLTTVPMNSTALGLIVDGLFGPILKFGFHYNIAGCDIYMGEMFFTMLIIIFFALFNIKGLKVAGVIQTILAILLASSVLILIVATMINPKASFNNAYPLWGFDKSSAIEAYQTGEYSSIDEYSNKGIFGIITGILATLAIAPWAFVGFDTIPQVVEESNFSNKKVKLIMTIAILFGCFVYIANNTITAIALENWPNLIIENETTPWLLLTATENLLGNFGKMLVGIAVLCAVLTGMMGFYMAASRLMFAMARDGYLPKTFAKLDNKYSTPKNAIIFCMIISLVGPVLGREALGWFVDMSSIGASIGFLFTCLATYVCIKNEKEKNISLKVIAILGSVFAFTFIVLQLIPIPGLNGVNFSIPSYLMLIIWCIIGIIFYFIQRKNFITK